MAPILATRGAGSALGFGRLFSAASGDFESIATVSLSSTTSAVIVFTSIPSTYSHLQLRGIYRDTWAVAGTGEFYIKPNTTVAATSFDSSFKWIFSGGTSGLTTAGYANRGDGIFMGQGVRNGSGANYFGGFVVDILDYKATDKYKTFRGVGGADLNGSGTVVAQSGLWQNTAAISSLRIEPNGEGFNRYCKFSLYGIKDAV